MNIRQSLIYKIAIPALVIIIGLWVYFNSRSSADVVPTSVEGYLQLDVGDSFNALQDYQIKISFFNGANTPKGSKSSKISETSRTGGIYSSFRSLRASMSDLSDSDYIKFDLVNPQGMSSTTYCFSSPTTKDVTDFTIQSVACSNFVLKLNNGTTFQKLKSGSNPEFVFALVDIINNTKRNGTPGMGSIMTRALDPSDKGYWRDVVFKVEKSNPNDNFSLTTDQATFNTTDPQGVRANIFLNDPLTLQLFDSTNPYPNARSAMLPTGHSYYISIDVNATNSKRGTSKAVKCVNCPRVLVSLDEGVGNAVFAGEWQLSAASVNTVSGKIVKDTYGNQTGLRVTVKLMDDAGNLVQDQVVEVDHTYSFNNLISNKKYKIDVGDNNFEADPYLSRKSTEDCSIINIDIAGRCIVYIGDSNTNSSSNGGTQSQSVSGDITAECASTKFSKGYMLDTRSLKPETSNSFDFFGWHTNSKGVCG